MLPEAALAMVLSLALCAFSIVLWLLTRRRESMTTQKLLSGKEEAMKKQDYERVSSAIRATLDEEIERQIDEGDSKTRSVVRETCRALAERVAADFLAVNPRFKVDQFINDALGGQP